MISFNNNPQIINENNLKLGYNHLCLAMIIKEGI